MRHLITAFEITALVMFSFAQAPTAHACNGAGCSTEDSYPVYGFDTMTSDDGSGYSVSVSESYGRAGSGTWGPVGGAGDTASGAGAASAGSGSGDDGAGAPPGLWGRLLTAGSGGVGGRGSDPVEVARRAIASLAVDEPGILLDPDPAGNEWGATAVGFHIWFHAPRPEARQVLVSQDGLAVQITAVPGSLSVDTGDGRRQACRRTVPYRSPEGVDAPSPYCGHAWQHPGRYTVSAARTWHITWTAGGRTGTDTITRPAGTCQIDVIELTSVLTDPDR